MSKVKQKVTRTRKYAEAIAESRYLHGEGLQSLVALRSL